MTIGERIKKIRVFRKMTMDELGGALGFEGKNMSVRISQYETGARIPGEDMILKLADALTAITRQSLITALVLLKISSKHFSGLKKVPHLSLHVEKAQDFQSIQLPAT